jgi:tetratricopeptide (TPR) repeat protein
VSDASTPAGVFLCTGPLKHSWVSADDAARCCNGYVREKRVSRDSHGNPRLEFFWRKVDAAPPTEPEMLDADIVPAPALSSLDGDEDDEPPSGGGLSHGPFFRRVAEIADDTTPTWRALTAGLLTLRLVDRWATRNITGRTPTLKEFVLVRRTIDDIDDDRVHEVLIKMTDCMRELSADDVGSMPKLLFAYGLLLEEVSEWMLAIDVYETLLEVAKRPDDHVGIPLVYQRLGLCHRQLGRLCQASQIYQRGLRVARSLRDTSGALQIRVSEADLAMEQGEFEKASDILDAVIAEARPDREADRETRARACHDRGSIAARYGQYEAAAPLLYEAFEGYGRVRWQLDALDDLAGVLSALGAHEGANDAYHLLYDMSEQPDIRIGAAINMMRLAGESGDTLVFEEWRQAIESGPLSTRFKAEFYLRLGEGYQRMGQRPTASLAYKLLEVLARDNALPDFATLAEAGLRGDPPPAPPRLVCVPSGVAALVERLHERRALATV